MNKTDKDPRDFNKVSQNFKASIYDYGAWEPMTVKEFTKVKSKYKDIYD